MNIYIFDIDGTLTSTDQALTRAGGHETHAFWDLITYYFVSDKASLKQEISLWREGVAQLSEEQFILSSKMMLQRSLNYLPAEITEQNIIDRAKEITSDFIRSGVVISEAIAFLDRKVNEGHICVLSTGSYESGAQGFLAALHEHDLISPVAFDSIIVSGAVVDWKAKQVTHANIHNNKIKGLNEHLAQKHRLKLPLASEAESKVYVYADDPAGNDHGILTLTDPSRRFVIPQPGNVSDASGFEYHRLSWDSIITNEYFHSSMRP